MQKDKIKHVIDSSGSSSPRSGNALSFLALVLSVMCVCFSIHADIVKTVSRWNVAAALVSGALGGVTVQAAGKFLRGDDGYCMWQPFRGGLSFVLLQYFGWLFYGVAMMMFAVLLYSHERIVRKSGTISSVGLLASASVLTLLASIPRFREKSNTWLDSIHLIKKDNLVVIACAVSGLVFCILVELKFQKLEQYHFGLRASILALMAVAGVLVLIIGKHRFRGKKIFHPLQGGFYFVLMQSSGWAGFAVGASLFVSVAFDEDVLPGILFSVTFLMSSSLILLVLSLDCFHEIETARLLRKLRLTREMVACVMIGLLATATNVLLDLAWRPQSFLSIFAVACHVLVAPSLHVFASRVHHSYHLWQPFCGGPRFIVLQGVGWTLFAVSHVVCVLAVVNSVRFLVGSSSFFVFLSDVVICVSVTFFVPESDDTDDGSPSPKSPMGSRKTAASENLLMNGEIVTSLLMIVGGAMTLITVDLYPIPTVFSKWQICLFSIVLMLLSYGVAHLSGRKIHPTYPLIRPFHGGPDHVALQTVGWTIWGTLVALFSVLEINLAVAPQHVPQGSITACTLLTVFGFCIISASVPLYRDDESSPRRRATARVTLDIPSHDADRWLAAAEEASRIAPLLHSPELRQVLSSLIDEVGSATNHTAGDRAPAAQQQTSAADEGFGAMSLAVVLSCGSLVVLVICEIFSVLLDVSRRGAVIGPLAFCASTASVMSWLLTHGVAGQRRFPSSYRWWMPFSGGFNFALMQTVAWGFCSMHLATLSVILYSLQTGFQPYLGSYMVLGFFGFTCHMLLIMSLSQFEPVRAPSSPDGSSTSFLARNSEWFVGSLLTIFALCTLSATDGAFLSGTTSLPVAPVIFCGTLALALAVPLGWISVMKSRSSPVVPVGSSATYHLSLVTEVFACTVAAVWILQRMMKSFGEHWYVTCICFVAVVHHVVLLLTIVWNEQRSLYIVALELAAEFVTFAIYSFHYAVVGIFVYVGFFVHISLASVAFFVAVNLLSFNSPVAVRTVQVFTAVVLAVEGCRGSLAPVLFLSPVLLYSSLYRGETLWNRSRFSPKIASRVQFLWQCAARYFSYRVISDFTVHPSDGRPVLFGFHPHGVCPYTSMWGTHCRQWISAGLPTPVIHASSFLLSVPIVRDFMLLLGVVDCSVVAIRHTLRSGLSGLVVPGGTQEALQPLPPTEQVTLVVKNKGLFRIALQEGASLVPIFCFGEADIISGIPLPSFQFWAQRKLGITYPQLPHGRLLLPLPRRRPVTVVVGSSIPVHKVEFPTPAEIDALHRLYYDRLVELFDRHKASCGFPDARLVVS